MTEREAWKLLAEGYDNPIQPEPQGLCARVRNLRRTGKITYVTQGRMHDRIFKEGRRLGKRDVDTAFEHIWPLGEAGWGVRRAFCQRMERVVGRVEGVFLILKYTLILLSTLVIVRGCA